MTHYAVAIVDENATYLICGPFATTRDANDAARKLTAKERLLSERDPNRESLTWFALDTADRTPFKSTLAQME